MTPTEGFPALPPLDRSAPLLLLAPHLRFPPRNGADITQERLAVHLSRHLPFVDLVAEDRAVRYRGGAQVAATPFPNRMREKAPAALRTILRRSHYLQERFLTPGYRAEAVRRLEDPAYRTVLFSYCCTASLLDAAAPPPGRLHLVYTHNDQLQWFRDVETQARNPAARLAARLTQAWYGRFFEQHGRDTLFLYVTEADRRGHAVLPPHRARVTPIGVELPAALPEALEPGPVRLLFIGALNVATNGDALRHFGERFWPALHASLDDDVAVTVAGSNPTVEVEARCRAAGWRLEPNVSGERLEALYREAAFALLPFPYATGAKLKLLGALSHGVPVLATPCIDVPSGALPAPSLRSDVPADWVAACARARAEGMALDQRKAQRAEAARHTWATVADDLVRALAAGRG